MTENIARDRSELIDTRKEEIVSRRLVLKHVLTVGCGVMLPIVLIGCDSTEGNRSTSARAAPNDAPDSVKKSSAASIGSPDTGTDSPGTRPGPSKEPAATSTAPGKVAKAAVQYQVQPKGDQQCGRCAHFTEPNACAVVEGEISPEGWCTLWAPKSS